MNADARSSPPPTSRIGWARPRYAGSCSSSICSRADGIGSITRLIPSSDCRSPPHWRGFANRREGILRSRNARCAWAGMDSRCDREGAACWGGGHTGWRAPL